MPAPVLTVRIDWDADGTFTADLAQRVLECSWGRGRSSDNSAEAKGSAAIVLDNRDDAFVFSSFDELALSMAPAWYSRLGELVGIGAWDASGHGIHGTWVGAPTLGSAGLLAGDTDASATVTAAGAALNLGAQTFGGAFAGRNPFTVAAWVNVTSDANFRRVFEWVVDANNLVRILHQNTAIFASRTGGGTAGDASGAVLSAGTHLMVARYDGTNIEIRVDCAQKGTVASTGSMSASAGVTSFFADTTAGNQVNGRGDEPMIFGRAITNDEEAALYAAGTKLHLLPGLPVHAYATYGGTDYPGFYGFIERVTPNPEARTVAVTVYDPLQRMSETDTAVPGQGLVIRSARDYRLEVLGDLERGALNCLANPAFAVDTTGWSGAGTLTRVTTDAVPGSAVTACGQWVAASAGQTIQQGANLIPVILPGQTYRISAYLKLVSGSALMRFGGTYNAVTQDKPITLTTAWQRFTTTMVIPSTVLPVGLTTPNVLLTAMGAGTMLVGNVSVTRGQPLYPYADVGTGRWPNWCMNGSFDGDSLTGWYDASTNLITNPSFETNTTGWAVTADSFHLAGTTITRVAATPQFGTARADLAGGAASGTHFTIAGTFKQGVTYRASIFARVAAGATTATVGIGSNGTPADKAENVGASVTVNYGQISVSWTPSADRSDVHFYVITVVGTTLMLDGASVFRLDTAPPLPPFYSDTGPAGGTGSFTTSFLTAAGARFGSRCQSVITPATAGSGRVYDFGHIGCIFLAGRAYTLSMWVNPTSNMPYRIGFGANKLDGTFDEATATGTATANVWTQLTVTWTPTANRIAYSSSFGLLVTALIQQTDATARTFLLDGVRVIPGASADAFEMTQWSLANEPDIYGGSQATFVGSALSSLSTINSLTLTRHWVEPEMASPWYTYRTEARDDIALKASAETFDDDIAEMSSADIDRAAIVNTVVVQYGSSLTEVYSDEVSVRRYGPRPATISGSTIFNGNRTYPDIVGPALVSRYRMPRARPVMKVTNRWPSQLVRELEDFVTVNFARLKIKGGRYLILRLDTKVTKQSAQWDTTYQLETMP